MFDAATGEHIYVSTACMHDRHELCRLGCKYCGAPCWCNHHYPEGTPVTEPLDNPAAPDADSDEPVELDPAEPEGDDEDDSAPEDDEPVDPPADDDGEEDPEDSDEDEAEAPAVAEPDDPPVAIESD